MDIICSCNPKWGAEPGSLKEAQPSCVVQIQVLSVRFRQGAEAFLVQPPSSAAAQPACPGEEAADSSQGGTAKPGQSRASPRALSDLAV